MSMISGIRGALCCISVALLCLALSGGVRMNVSDSMHWDSANYLSDARAELVQGSMLERVDATHIVENLSSRIPTGDFRRISRYGTAWILARILQAGPGGAVGISHMRTVFSLFLLASLLGIGAFLYRVAPTNQNKRGASIAVILLLISGTPLFRYLNGNLVSEVPALLMTTLASLAFVHGLRPRRDWWCAVGGGLSFLAYSVRMDSCLIPVFLAVAGLWLFPSWYGWRRYLRCCLLAATAFGLGVSAYVMLAGEIVSPHIFLRFVTQASPLHWKLSSADGIVVVLRTLGPFLVLMLASLMAGERRLLLFAWTWLLLCLVPFAVLISNGAWIETRFLALSLQPVALVCLLGVDSVASAVRDRAGKPFGLAAMRAAVPVLLAITLLVFSAPGGQWMKVHLDWQVGVPEREKGSLHIVDLESLVEQLEANGGRAAALVFPRARRWPLRLLCRYFSGAQPLDSGRQMKQVFGAIRPRNWEVDVEHLRRVAASRLGARESERLRVQTLGRWNAWGLVVVTREF